jgi:hypothetical protein
MKICVTGVPGRPGAAVDAVARGLLTDFTVDFGLQTR